MKNKQNEYHTIPKSNREIVESNSNSTHQYMMKIIPETRNVVCTKLDTLWVSSAKC